MTVVSGGACQSGESSDLGSHFVTCVTDGWEDQGEVLQRQPDPLPMVDFGRRPDR